MCSFLKHQREIPGKQGGGAVAGSGRSGLAPLVPIPALALTEQNQEEAPGLSNPQCPCLHSGDKAGN